MLGALARLFVLAGALYALWALLRPRRRGAPPDAGELGGPPELRVVEMRRPPHEVLGVREDATPAEIEAARDRLLRDNDPSRVTHMSPEVRAAAERVCREVRAAAAEMLSRPRRG